MTDIDQLLRALECSPPEVPAVVQFYAHVTEDGRIVGLSPTPCAQPGLRTYTISEQLALDFMSGVENFDEWMVTGAAEHEQDLKRLERPALHTSVRVHASQMIELPMISAESWDYRILLNRRRGTVTVQAAPGLLERVPVPLQLYFTCEGDPTVLKFSVNMSAQALHAAGARLSFRVPGINDLSILTVNRGLKFSVEWSNEI